MIFILLACAIALLIFEYKMKAKYLLHPAVVVLSVFALSIFTAAANYSRWGDISSITLWVILLGLLTFVIGCNIASNFTFLFRNKSYIVNHHLNGFFAVDISSVKTFVVIIIMSVVTYYTYINMKQLVSINIVGFFSTVLGARGAIYGGDRIAHNTLIQQGLYLCRVIAYIYIYQISYRKTVLHRKIRFLDIVPIVIYLIQAFLSTGRTEFIYITYAALFINYCIFMSTKNWQKNRDLKYSNKILIGVLSFFVIFLLISNMRTQGKTNISKVLGVYIGSPIYALDNYIRDNGIFKTADYWGEETQSLYYSVMSAFGQSSTYAVATLQPIFLGSEQDLTNIFTALRRYLHDYGIIGMSIILFILGYIYSISFKALRKRGHNDLRVLIYSFLSYPLVEMAIEERFFSNLVTARTIYCYIYFIILFKLLITQSANEKGETDC